MASVSMARPRRPLDRGRWLTALALAVTVGYAVSIGQRSLVGLGGPDDPMYQTGLQQIAVTTFLHVGVAAAAFWLVALGRRAGFVVATGLGIFTLVIFALAVSAPRQAGPPLVPAWLHAVGLLAAVVMTGGGIQQLLARSAPPA